MSQMDTDNENRKQKPRTAPSEAAEWPYFCFPNFCFPICVHLRHLWIKTISRPGLHGVDGCGSYSVECFIDRPRRPIQSHLRRRPIRPAAPTASKASEPG